MSLLILSPDLMFASQFRAVAETQGIACSQCLTAEQASEVISDAACHLAIVDLSIDTLDVERFVQHARQANNGEAKLIAFAPHVHREKLAWAETVGFDAVMSRGEIIRRTAEILSTVGPKE